MTVHDDAIAILKELIETNEEAARGFQTVAEAIDDPELRPVLTCYAEERRRFATELRQVVDGAAATGEPGGSRTGSLRRGWMREKAAFTGGDRHAVLAAAETGEDSAVQAYQRALTDLRLRAEARALVEQQAASVQHAHDHVRRLRDATRIA